MKKQTLYLDLETYSETPIDYGVYKYAETAEILLWAYALDDGPVRVWDVMRGGPWQKPVELEQYLDMPGIELCAHNSNFDRVVLSAVLGPHYSTDYKWRDTMVRAFQHGLPGALDKLCDIFKIDSDKAKIKEGKQLVHLFCKPQPASRKIRRATRVTHPEQWAKFVEYATHDILAMRELDKKLPKWNDTEDEYNIWQLDQRINDRGFAVDLELAQAAIAAVEKEQAENRAKTNEMTDGVVGSATQRDKLLKYLLEIHGVDLPDMTISTLERRLNDPDLPEPVKDLINLRLQSAGTSTKKYHTFINAACKDGRVRGTLQYGGAQRTLRWGGRLVQPQNYPRPQFGHEEIELGVEAVKNGSADLIYDSVTDMCSSMIRSVVVAGDGKKLAISDLSSIEGRALAWLAGEEWKLQAYCELDAGESEYDMYVLTYANTFQVKPETVDKAQRTLGKTLELAMGYGGGAGAFVTFANGFGIDLDALGETAYQRLPDWAIKSAHEYWNKCDAKAKRGLGEKTFVTCDAIKRMWRRANPMITSLWSKIESAMRSALEVKGTAYDINGLLSIDTKGSWLRMRLPSGRYLNYPGARIADNKIQFYGINQYSRKWCLLSTFGGRLCIAEDTLVLTIDGWLPIQNIYEKTIVWDGENWVYCMGGVYKGITSTVEAYGVQTTLYHEVLTTEGWKTASQSSRYNRAPCRLPYGYKIPWVRRAQIYLAYTMRLWKKIIHRSIRIKKTEKTRACSFLWMQKIRNTKYKITNTWNVKPSGFFCLESNDRSMPTTNTPGLEKLRSKRYKSLSELAKKVYEFLGGYGADLCTGFNNRSYRQQSRIFKKELSMGYLERTSEEYKKNTNDRHSLWPHVCRRIIRAVRCWRNYYIVQIISGLHPKTINRKAKFGTKVYDLIDCGPKHRFVVADKWGNPLIVHNCENATQAASRDILAHGITLSEANGYPVVMHVHDEIVAEVPDTPEYNHETLSRLMSTVPPWAPGLPLNAKGFESYRYRKD